MASGKDLTKGPVGKNILKLTFGMMIGMIGMVGFSLLDTYFVGHLGTTELAAMSFTFPVVMITTGIALGIGIGTSSVVSRAIGNKDTELVQKLTTNSLILGFTFVAVMITLGLLTIGPVFKLIGASDELLVLIREYMEIWYLGVPFVVIPMVANNAMRASGNTFIPSMVMISAVTVNGILDPLLIFGIGPFPRMELQGAALATVFARMTTFLISLSFLRFKFDMIWMKIPLFRELVDSWRKVLFVGFPAMVNHFIPPVSMGIITRIVSSYGKEAVAGLGVSTRIEMFAMGPMIALATVMIAFTGQNYGAGDFKRIMSGIKFSRRFSLITGMVLFLILSIPGKQIAALFDSDPSVTSVVALYLSFVAFGYGSQGVIMMSSSCFNALNKPYTAIGVNALRMFGLYVPLAVTGGHLFGLPGVFAGAGFSMVAGAFISSVWLKRTIEKMDEGKTS